MFGSSATPHDFGVSLGSELFKLLLSTSQQILADIRRGPLNVASMPSAIEIYDLSEA